MARSAPLAEHLRARLAAIVARDGEHVAVARLRIARPTLARALAGLPLLVGNQELVRARLDVVEAEDERLRQAP